MHLPEKIVSKVRAEVVDWGSLEDCLWKFEASICWYLRAKVFLQNNTLQPTLIAISMVGVVEMGYPKDVKIV